MYFKASKLKVYAYFVQLSPWEPFRQIFCSDWPLIKEPPVRSRNTTVDCVSLKQLIDQSSEIFCTIMDKNYVGFDKKFIAKNTFYLYNTALWQLANLINEHWLKYQIGNSSNVRVYKLTLLSNRCPVKHVVNKIYN